MRSQISVLGRRAAPRHDGDGTRSVVQRPMGDPAEFQTDQRVTPSCSDNQQVRGGRALCQHLVGEALDRTPADAHLGMFTHRRLQGTVEQLRRPLRVFRHLTGEEEVLDRFMRRPTPGMEHLQFRVPDCRLAEGEPHGGRIHVLAPDAQQDALMSRLQRLPVSSDDDNRAVGTCGHGETDRSQQ